MVQVTTVVSRAMVCHDRTRSVFLVNLVMLLLWLERRRNDWRRWVDDWRRVVRLTRVDVLGRGDFRRRRADGWGLRGQLSLPLSSLGRGDFKVQTHWLLLRAAPCLPLLPLPRRLLLAHPCPPAPPLRCSRLPLLPEPRCRQPHVAVTQCQNEAVAVAVVVALAPAGAL